MTNVLDELALTFIYYKSGIFHEVLIFTNFARRTNLRIEESRENYYYNIIALLKKNEISRILNFVKSFKIRNSGKFNTRK